MHAGGSQVQWSHLAINGLFSAGVGPEPLEAAVGSGLRGSGGRGQAASSSAATARLANSRRLFGTLFVVRVFITTFLSYRGDGSFLRVDVWIYEADVQNRTPSGSFWSNKSFGNLLGSYYPLPLRG